ncbi:SpoIID/LytB domain-containing protein [Bacillus sp. FJAT-51639]|uniref:SpoIID/LytB domain-containing protein n=1 Tax=Bacillus bruguierae TaxID=3127667 RepID=A0ABU8FMD6_9BACI
MTSLDYFRKVASHEVGVDYHVEAIKVNVIAIVSYTLNWIYTEYYKWAGYDFDITCISEDQVFIPNQSMQSNIIDVVDEILGQYIGTLGLNSPILSQYGKTPVRDTLYQLKANELARSEKNNMEILRHFYNRKYKLLELRTATPIGGI